MAADASGAERPPRPRDLSADLQDGVGQRLRAGRERQGLSLRELARRLALSPSALSQIETGRSRPSVGTLYAIVTALGLSLDALFGSSPASAAVDRGSEAPSPVQRAAERRALELDSGVRWERLTPTAEAAAEFLYVVYEVGGSSSRAGTYLRQTGREYGLVLSGRLRASLGFDETHELGPGDSIAFDAVRPHRLENVGDEPVHAVWFVAGRGGRQALDATVAR